MQRTTAIILGICAAVLLITAAGSGFMYYRYTETQRAFQLAQEENQRALQLAQEEAQEAKDALDEATRPPARPTLSIKQIGIGTEVMLERDAKDVTFLKFEATAEGGDALLIKVVFMDGYGRFSNAGNLSLWVDTNGDGQADSRPIQTVSPVQLSRLVVQDLTGNGYLIPDGKAVIFEIRSDVQSLVNGHDGMTMLLRAEPGEAYIEAKGAQTGEPLRGMKTISWDGGREFTDNNCQNDICEITVRTARHLMTWISAQ